MIDPINMPEWSTRALALARLGVKPQTLYAYVSRKRIEVRPDPDDPRRSLYNAADIEALAAARGQKRTSEAIAGRAIAWGTPVLATAISTIEHGRLVYRGRDAAVLADALTLEACASILWDGDARPPSGIDRPAREGTALAAILSLLGTRAASGEASYVTGHVLNVDGGFMSTGMLFDPAVRSDPFADAARA